MIVKYAEIYGLFRQSEVDIYNQVINDRNPIHFDEEFCVETIFKAPIVPGLLASGLFGGLLGSNLPDGAILLGINLKFIAPIYINENVHVYIKFINKKINKSIFIYKLICQKKNGEIAIEGEAILKL